MSKRKRDVSFIKPDEPAFIARMKTQIGYKEGPTVDTKREVLTVDEEDFEQDDEQPQVVVVIEGDLTAEEANKIQRDKDEGPADLNKRIVFHKPSKASVASDKSAKSIEENRKTPKHRERDEKGKANIASQKNRKNPSQKSSLLSFNEEDESQE